MSISPLPGDASNDPTDDQTGRMVRQPNGRVRPLSPHLQVWRWHVTMLGSILHRVSGGALSVGALLIGLWLLAMASGPGAYATFVQWMGSPFGLFVWFGLTLALAYHLASGVRHLIWDTGAGLAPRTASLLTTITIVVGVLIAVGFWAALFASGRVVL
jgi:succinate dehydrogenase / fumarate reductase cytochrome b subunit